MDTAQKVRDDSQLLRLVATQRDEAAFAEIYDRHIRAASSLAFHIVGNAAHAEEVVQNGMVKVWSAAGTFRAETDASPPHNAKAWIMKIIAREAFMILRRRNRLREAVMSGYLDVADSPREQTPQETVDALQKGLSELPELDRQLIALHFGGGLTQTEISKSLSISQQVISYRITRALKSLKSSMAALGVSAVAAIDGHQLQAALLSHPAAVPASGGVAAVLDRIQNGGATSSTSARQTRRLAKKASTPTAAYVGGAVLVLAVVAGIAAMKSRAPAPQPAPIAPVAPPPAAAPVLPPAPQPRAYRWTFENGPAKDLVVTDGNWVWQKKDKSMRVNARTTIGIDSARLAPGPYVFIVKAEKPPEATVMSFGVRLINADGEVPILEHWRLDDVHFESTMNEERAYLAGNSIVEYMGGKPSRVIIHPVGHTYTGLLINFENTIIREIELRPITEAELPPEMLTPKKLMEGMVEVQHLTIEQQNELLKKQMGGSVPPQYK